MNITALSLRLETHSSGYSLQLSYCLLLARFHIRIHIWQAKMDETSTNFEKSRRHQKKIFLRIALNIALDMNCSLSPDGRIITKNYVEKIVYLYSNEQDITFNIYNQSSFFAPALRT